MVDADIITVGILVVLIVVASQAFISLGVTARAQGTRRRH